jgi:predicted dehydrogenase
MDVLTQSQATRAKPLRQRPRLGFLGVGWIGRHRLESVVRADAAEIIAIADANAEAVQSACEFAHGAEGVGSFEELLQQDLDGVVIATPSALHAEQAQAAFERGLAVFCQKPLARTADETEKIVAAAKESDRLLEVDFSYRYVRGVAGMRELIHSGKLGRVYAVDLTFHNAYGPDKPWFYDRRLAGGGCVIDLGIHLVDLACWMLGWPGAEDVCSRLFHQGAPADIETQVEDCAFADWTFAGGASARLACSWRLPAGCDAVIAAEFYGTEGAVALRNVNGSFYDFVVERFRGTSRERLAGPPDDWGGRAVLNWIEGLAAGGRFAAESERFVDVARLIDGIYAP